MLLDPYTILTDLDVLTALKQAWHDSQPGGRDAHEEGGFILQDSTGKLSVLRWPRGNHNTIVLPSHENCKVGSRDIVATFHTHPNTSGDYLQEPSETDKRAVRDDLDLKGMVYVGEFVVSREVTYFITRSGQVRQMEDTKSILS